MKKAKKNARRSAAAYKAWETRKGLVSAERKAWGAEAAAKKARKAAGYKAWASRKAAIKPESAAAFKAWASRKAAL